MFIIENKVSDEDPLEVSNKKLKHLSVPYALNHMRDSVRTKN